MGAFGQKQARAISTAALAIAILARFCDPASADLTVENLTSNAIAGIGPFYQDVQDAIQKFADKDYSGALVLLENAKKSTPRLAPSFVMMAQLFVDGNQPLQAIAMLEQGIARAPQDPEAYVMLAERAAGEGRATEAEFLFQKAAKTLETFTENPKRKQGLQLRTYTGWAAVDESRTDWKSAKAKLEQLVKLDPRNGTAHERLGRVLFRLSTIKAEKEAAYAEFKLAAEADKKIPPAELIMAELTLATDRAQAEKWLNLALEKSGDDLRTQLGAANYLMQSNQPEEAKKHAEEAIKLDAEGLDANLTMGLVSRMLADPKTAELHLSKAHLLAPSNSSIINNLALVLLELPDEGSRQRALQFAELNSRQNPNNVDAMATVGWVNYRLNRKAEAHRAFSAVLNYANVVTGSQKMTPDMAYYLANSFKDQGRISQAVKLLKDALNNNQPFAYRKPAQELLTQLSRIEKTAGSKGKVQPASKKTAGAGKPEPAAKTEKAEPAAKTEKTDSSK